MVNTLVLSFHIAAFLQAAFTLWYHYNYIINPMVGYGGNWVFLTFISMWVQLVVYLFSIGHDVCHLTNVSKWSHKCSSIRDWLCAVFGIPLSILVAILFWTLYCIDRSLVYPEYLDDIIPAWYNHLMHSAVSLLMLIELTLVHHHYPRRRNGVLWTFVLSMSYLAWITYTHHVSGRWPYNVLDELKGFAFFAFTLGSSAFCAVLYVLGEMLNTMTNNKEPTKDKRG